MKAVVIILAMVFLVAAISARIDANEAKLALKHAEESIAQLEDDTDDLWGQVQQRQARIDLLMAELAICDGMPGGDAL